MSGTTFTNNCQYDDTKAFNDKVRVLNDQHTQIELQTIHTLQGGQFNNFFTDNSHNLLEDQTLPVINLWHAAQIFTVIIMPRCTTRTLKCQVKDVKNQTERHPRVSLINSLDVKIQLINTLQQYNMMHRITILFATEHCEVL